MILWERERERDDNSGLNKLLEYVFGLDLVSYGYKIQTKHLWEITTWNKKFQEVDLSKQEKIIKYKKYFSAKELKDLTSQDGTIKILTTNKTNIFANEAKVDKYVDKGEVIYLPTGGNALVQYYKGKFITGGNVIAIAKDNNELNIKYLFYVLNNKLDLIASYYRGAGIQHPYMPDILEILIPIPSLDIQNKIVAILDNFSDLTNDLTKGLPAEINLQQKQYEYYRNKLLSFNKVS
ncbi:restriction endonuclease subunit S [Mycoplasmopsis bovirhinis]|uniref:Type I restriction-modification system subunit S n=1 Tax=Mycoplasmopsis bovirhinis TaxID=29553 RepID=A0A449ACX4_9BACT|nr:restriction endonuclease subunit S [Mycoplasmopsis bovirhinis]VEU62875.1 type I restriction-modification system subunit S [Mycoplasmopsis bovirhinis]